ncbi:HET-domain-containing protein, partial [Lentithecium fluviatile CBS 122367]
RNCIANHKSCREPDPHHYSLARLPKRLLDLSHGSNVVIVDVAEWVSSNVATIFELSEYCALSYRWGNGSHACVLSAPFATLLEMPLESMPQTFKDAIQVARRLGVRFLWIDALCIIQPSASGDDTDWRAEGPRMGVIYESAMFTIAA